MTQLTPRTEQAIALAEKWLNRANDLITSDEQELQEKMLHMLARPEDKFTLMEMVDQSFRPHDVRKVSKQVMQILREHDIPTFFNGKEKFLTKLFMGIGHFFPSIAVPALINQIRNETKKMILPGEENEFKAHLHKRKKEGVRMNINHLGEALLGEEEALNRFNAYVKTLQDPDIEYVSVKISTIYSQINSLAFESTVKVLKERLTKLYETADANFFIRHDGTKVKKFVNLDMEEFRDLDITIAAFMETLDQPHLKGASAGIVLQAYLPDSYNKQVELTEWAKKRIAEGGASIKIRIVKGANMEMEKLESSIRNWSLAPYDNKLDVDANYKKMMEYGCKPENIKAVQLGMASHNLFELAYSYLTAEELGVTEHFTFEMLEGMADHVRKAIQEMTGEVLMYAPEAKREQFINAIGYLVRRLDENTADDNFLRHSFNLQAGTEEWEFLKKQFVESVAHKDVVSATPKRQQNRLTETFEKVGTYHEGVFKNEADTDFSLAPNREWARQIREKWSNLASDPMKIPFVVGGEEIYEGRETRELIDPSKYQNENREVIGTWAVATWEDAQRAIKTAKADPDGWRDKTRAERHEILAKVSNNYRTHRAELIGAAAADNGKVFTESDVEVSEAIDFAEWYPHSVKMFEEMENIENKPKGVALVIPPWNFPLAIPSGGVFASLAAGNTVIIKPATDAVMTAWTFCNLFWEAGVSKNTLQLMLSPSSTGVPTKLVTHPDIDYVILTGGTETALMILEKRPELFIAAETGGKDATIVTALADKDQAIKNIIHSAFSNCGQKCSATSLLILEKEVYEDEEFKRQLVDAANSMTTGSAWDFKSKLGPLNSPPKGDLKRSLEELHDGESWALKPTMVDNNPYIWTPSIKYGVKDGSYCHMTEFFGPMLSVMCAENLDHAIELVNKTGYGLTSGIETLDEGEKVKWKNSIKAGNLYINRGTTGAIVMRQPFGGMGKSAIGPGIKVGGPNYISQFMDFKEVDFPKYEPVLLDHPLARLAGEWEQAINDGSITFNAEEAKKSVHAIRSYLYHYDQEFSKEHDYFNLYGEDNIIRYITLGIISIRVHKDDSFFDVIARIAAARISGSEVMVSIPYDLENDVTAFLNSAEGTKLLGNIPVMKQSDAEVIESMKTVNRISYAGEEKTPIEVMKAAAETGYYVSRKKPLMEGRIELIHYFQEQSISHDYHRYGNLGLRSLGK